MGVCLKLGSKSDVFLLDGNTWLCSTGLPSDVIINVGEMSFRLHKFPLLSRSGVLKRLIEESHSLQNESSRHSMVQLHNVPGGAKAFLLVAKFCYDVRLELNSSNIVSLRCAAEFLQMSEEYGEKNLVYQTETFLEEILNSSWVDTLRVLELCQDREHALLPCAEELHIISRCIDALAVKACADSSLFNWPVSSSAAQASSNGTTIWNGIQAATGRSELHPSGNDWWYEDASYLKFPFYKRLIRAVALRGMKSDVVAGSVIHYGKKYLPITGRQAGTRSSSSSSSSCSGSIFSVPLTDPDERQLLEEIVELLPYQKGVAPTNFLLGLLRTSMILHASPSCQENLETRVGAQLDEASLEDLLIPNMDYSAETLYDIDCVQRMLDHFLMLEKDSNENATNCCDYRCSIVGYNEEGYQGFHSMSPVSRVANLIDAFLAEVAPDVNLKPAKFKSLAAAVPDYSRKLDDGIYRAIDIYLKAHPWLTDHEKEQLCRLINSQKLSLEASAHAAQNQRLPLRVIVQVLFFEQLRLRKAIAGCLFTSENVVEDLNDENKLLTSSRRFESARFSQSHHHHHEDQIVAVDDDEDTRERVMELEKECVSIKHDLEKLTKNNKRSWNDVLRKFVGLKLKSATSVSGDKEKRNKLVEKSDDVPTEQLLLPPCSLPPSLPVKFVNGDEIKGYEA